MPPTGQPIVWTVSEQRIDAADLYAEGGFGDTNGFLRNALESVGRMHAVLDEPWPEHVAAFQFAGSGLATVTRLAEHKGLRQVTDNDAGDKTVPLRSATSTTAPTMILPGEHLDLVNNRKLRRTLSALLGAGDGLVVFAASAEDEVGEEQTVQLSVPVLGVVPDPDGRTRAELLVTLSQRLKVDMRLRIDIIGLDSRTEQPEPSLLIKQLTVTLNCGTLDQTINFDAALTPGFYRLSATLPGGVQDQTTLVVRQAEV